MYRGARSASIPARARSKNSLKAKSNGKVKTSGAVRESKPEEKTKIWFNGKLVNWWDATVHVMSHVIHYGSSVFEGFRCYNSKRGPAIFRLKDHIDRLFDSAKIYRIHVPFSRDEIIDACIEVVRENDLKECYLRPVIFRGYGTLGVDPHDTPTTVAIAALMWGKYLGAEALERGVDVRIASWARMRANTFPSMAKSGANYMPSQLVRLEARFEGYTEGIMLDTNGYVSEGSGENVFAVYRGKIYTPPFASSVLPGITRDSVIKIAKDFGYEIVEGQMPREMLYIAEEVFLTGSAAEITPVRSIDKIQIGSGTRGPVTERLQKQFFEIIEGETDDVYGWLTMVR